MLQSSACSQEHVLQKHILVRADRDLRCDSTLGTTCCAAHMRCSSTLRAQSFDCLRPFSATSHSEWWHVERPHMPCLATLHGRSVVGVAYCDLFYLHQEVLLLRPQLKVFAGNGRKAALLSQLADGTQLNS